MAAYQEACAEVLSDAASQGTGALPSSVDPNSVGTTVDDKTPHDQQFRMFHAVQGAEGLSICVGNFDIHHRNIGIFRFNPNDKSFTREKSIPWSSSCEDAERILGKDSFERNKPTPQDVCSDEPWSPQLEALAQEGHSLTLTKFADYCTEKLDQATGRNFSAGFSWDRVRLEVQADHRYVSLVFEDPAVGFYCEGLLSLQDHVLQLVNGKLKPNTDPQWASLIPWVREEPNQDTIEFFSVDDTCSLGRGLGLRVSAGCEDQVGGGQWLDEAAEGKLDLLGWVGLSALGATTPLRRVLAHLPVLRSLEIFHNFRLPVFYNWRVFEQPLMVRVGKGAIVPVETRVKLLFEAWRSPAHPTHLATKSFVRGLDVLVKTAGAAYLGAFIYDRVLAAAGVVEDDPWRRIGTPVVGATTLTALATHEMRAGTELTAKGALSRAGSVGRFATQLGDGLVAVALLDFGVGYFLVGDDYDHSINQRTADAAYASDTQELAELEKSGFWGRAAAGLGETGMGLRRTVRWLAPSAMEWAVSVGNPEIETALRYQDRKACLEARENLRDVLLPLAAMRDPQTPFDFSFLYSKAEPVSRWFVQSLSSLGEEKTQKAFNLSDEEMATRLRQLALHNFQEAVTVLYAIEIDTNDWARRFFHPSGTLRAGHEVALLEELFGPMETWGPHLQAMKSAVQESRAHREKAFVRDFLQDTQLSVQAGAQ